MKINKHNVRISILSFVMLVYGGCFTYLKGQHFQKPANLSEIREGNTIEKILFGDTFIHEAKMAGAMASDLPAWAKLDGCERLAGYLKILGQRASSVVAAIHPFNGVLPLDIAREIGCSRCIELLENVLEERLCDVFEACAISEVRAISEDSEVRSD